MKKYNFNKEEIDDMIDLYCNKMMSIRYIAKKYKVDTSVICSRLKKNNVVIAKGSPYSLDYWIERGLSEEEALNHLKLIKPVYPEYWINKGYSQEEARFKIECHLMNTERAFIEKYGEIEGKKKFKNYKYKQGQYHSQRSVNYWINKGFSEEESKNKVSEVQSTFSKEICIQKYGKKKGLEIFTKRQENWQKSLLVNGNLKLGYSKISQELFYELLEYYSIREKNNIKFATHNGEFKIKKDNGGIWLYDFVDLNNRKIIEYNGDYFHANPKKFLSEDKPNPFNNKITSQELWDKDKEKANVANNNGFEVLVIWDSEYRHGNKKKVIDKCLKFLGKKND